MAFTHLGFHTLGGRGGAHPLEKQKLVDGQPVVLLEFGVGSEDPNWCERGHIIYTLSGALELVVKGTAFCRPSTPLSSDT